MHRRCSAGNPIPCSASTYNSLPDQIDMGACTPCPINSYSEQASTSVAACFCESGYYDELYDSDHVSCVLCPVAANCTAAGLTLSSLPLKRGYWRTGAGSDSLLQCPDYSSDDTACVGGAGDDLCKPWCVILQH